MKQVIVLCAMILLGIVLYQLIMGQDDSSVYSVVKDLWEQEIRMKTEYP